MDGYPRFLTMIHADRVLAAAGQGRCSIAPVRFTAVAAGSGSSHVVARPTNRLISSN
jgi:hypothetical protein